jgi:thioredoxin-like negative regulator of GroEL
MRHRIRHPSIAAILAFAILGLVACGGDGAPAPTVSGPTAPASPPGILDITSVAQFEAEIAKPRPGVVVVADFHAEWCGPCRKLGPELVALAAANPGRLYVLKIDTDQHPALTERFQAETIPLLVKFSDGKESARKLGYEGKERLTAWVGVP